MNENFNSEAENQGIRLAYTAQEVADMLAVTTKTVYRLVDRDLLKSSKALRHLRITRQSIEKFLAETSGELIQDKPRNGKNGSQHNLGLGSRFASRSVAVSKPKEQKGEDQQIQPGTAQKTKCAIGMPAAE